MGRSIPARVRLVLALAVIAACLAVYAVGALAADLTFPPLTGRVVDAASLLTPDQRQALDAKLKAHEDKTSDQVVVATVPSLQGTSIEDFANRLFRAWQLGQAKINNGVLLLVAPQERKVRIEVGYGLEGALTDAQSRTITASAITPRFKTGDWFGGLDAGVDGIVAILARDAQEWQRAPEPKTEAAADPVQIAIFVVLLLIVVAVAWRMARTGGRIGPGGGIVILPGPGSGGWGGGFSNGGSFGGGSSGGSDDSFSGGGGSSGGGGASDGW